MRRVEGDKHGNFVPLFIDRSGDERKRVLVYIAASSVMPRCGVSGLFNRKMVRGSTGRMPFEQMVVSISCSGGKEEGQCESVEGRLVWS